MLPVTEVGQPAAAACAARRVCPAGGRSQPSGGVLASGILKGSRHDAFPTAQRRDHARLRGGYWRRGRQGALPEDARWHPLVGGGRVVNVACRVERRRDSQRKEGQPTDGKCLWQGQVKPQEREPAERREPAVGVDGQRLVRAGLDDGEREGRASLPRKIGRGVRVPWRCIPKELSFRDLACESHALEREPRVPRRRVSRACHSATARPGLARFQA